MMEYNNPNSPWMHTGYDPYYENMSDDDRWHHLGRSVH